MDQPTSPRLRFVTAASLFDGHDAAINIMRRILQQEGVEVIHLGHDRSVDEIVDAAVEEDADGIAISSYQGGHNEYFRYMVDRLRERGRGDIRVFGGGGGTITDREIEELEAYGVARIYSVEEGRSLGLVGMIQDVIERAKHPRELPQVTPPQGFAQGESAAVARTLSWIETLVERAETDASATELLQSLMGPIRSAAEGARCVVVGLTGTGGAGKSSLTDELVRRALQSDPQGKIAILSVDPSRRRTGGALLGDRIRMNAVDNSRVYMRSLATRASHASVSPAVADSLNALRAAGFPLIFLETAGIGQSGSEVVDLADVSVYVMTPEYGAPTQLEKIDMLDLADLVVINKADKRGAEDALRYVRRQVQRNRGAFGQSPESMPVFACQASFFGDAGVDALFAALHQLLEERFPGVWAAPGHSAQVAPVAPVIPASRVRYLSEIVSAVRSHRRRGEEQARLAAQADGLARTLALLGQGPEVPAGPVSSPGATDDPELHASLRERYQALVETLDTESRSLLQGFPKLRENYEGEANSYSVRGREIRVENHRETLSGLPVPKVALPRSKDWGELVRWGWNENVPGAFPFTAGVFPYKRAEEDPARMFAGEGGPEQTNRRFHYLASGQPSVRLSTAFDSVTLYGRDPAERPDIWGKIGNSGVSVATLDDAKRLYSGFDLLAPSTSVSMTINGPAPIILAMFFNTAIDQAVERRLRESGRWESAIATLGDSSPGYRGELPDGHDGSGLGLLGISGDKLVPAEEYAEIRQEVLRSLRGTVQADILKEDQAQNTCIFSSAFALKLQGDLQSFFVENDIRNFYSVSISGYHIAEAGANPISQLAFTLANGFTFVEAFRARGLDIDDFARNLSFFFSNGIDPEYAVIGRVARRIWAVAMREVYGADERSQKLKYHIQTSGRSLHAQEIDFNDIRTTLQAFYAIADNCNSLHTNAYDEAITTPTEASVRRALAIQLILNREFGLLANENPLQGAYVIETLSELVEEAVLDEFERLSDRGGVLGAMELMYQRSKIQEESLLYEARKHSGELPIVGVNTFIDPAGQGQVVEVEMTRASEETKAAQIAGLSDFHARNAAVSAQALARLQEVARQGGNVFSELMETVKVCSLGQISEALFLVGGQYRRSM